MKRKRDDAESSGNVFADLGFRNSKQELLKAKLTVEIYKLLRTAGVGEECVTAADLDAPDLPGSGSGGFKPDVTASDLLYDPAKAGGRCSHRVFPNSGNGDPP
jgi:hypothetical protein